MSQKQEVLLLKQNLPTTALLRPLMVVSVGQLSYPSVFSSYEKILPSSLRELAWIPGIALHIIVFYGFKLPPPPPPRQLSRTFSTSAAPLNGRLRIDSLFVLVPPTSTTRATTAVQLPAFIGLLKLRSPPCPLPAGNGNIDLALPCALLVVA